MNSNKMLVMGIDHNSNSKLVKRIRMQKASWSLEYFYKLLEFTANLLVNLMCLLILNSQIIFFNYFSPFMAIGV